MVPRYLRLECSLGSFADSGIIDFSVRFVSKNARKTRVSNQAYQPHTHGWHSPQLARRR